MHIWLHRHCVHTSFHEKLLGNTIEQLAAYRGDLRSNHDGCALNHVFHVCVKKCNCQFHDCDDLVMPVFSVTVIGCLSDQYAEHFQCGRAWKHVVPFVLLDHTKITSVVCYDMHACLCVVSSLTIFDTSNHSRRFRFIKFFHSRNFGRTTLTVCNRILFSLTSRSCVHR